MNMQRARIDERKIPSIHFRRNARFYRAKYSPSARAVFYDDDDDDDVYPPPTWLSEGVRGRDGSMITIQSNWKSRDATM